jgi:microcystin degradation protein MlrC
VPTDLAAFERPGVYRGVDVAAAPRHTATTIAGFLDAAERHGFTALPIFAVWATPSGTVTREAFESLVSELVAGLERLAPLDGVLLSLHGAMVAEHVLGADGEILRRVRLAVGTATPVVAVLDLHANISAAMVEAADLLVGYHTYPHLDQRERGLEAAGLLLRLARRAVRPTVALVKPPLLPTSQRMTTDRDPMRTLMERARASSNPGRAYST